jgi:hypothetical protein
MGNPILREEFLQRARARFGERYDYTEIVYKSYKTPIKIRCREHPVKLITITPEKHLQTTGGCKFCLRQMRITMLERELGRGSAEHPPLSSSALSSSALSAPAAVSAVESVPPTLPNPAPQPIAQPPI